MAALVSPIVDIILRLWTGCARHTRYLRKLQKNKNLLSTTMNELKEARDDVQRRVVEEEVDPNEPKKRTEQIRGWLERVHTIEGEVEKILQKADAQLNKARCLGGCCPPNNCWSNYKLGKSITKKIPLVKDLKVKGDFQELTFVARPTNYLSKLQDNKILLKNAMEELKNVRNDVHRKVVEAEADHSEPKMRTDQVRGWLQSVEIIEGEVKVIMQTSDEQLSNTECHEKYKLVVMKMAYVDELKGKGLFQELTYRLPLPHVQPMNLEPTVGMESMFDKVWRLINNSTDDKPVRIMGLYGSGGIGKTTLLEKINNEYNKIKEHDHVIFAVVSKPINVQAIQTQIGEILGLSLQGDELSGAAKIFNVLRNKKFVILLDDLWGRVDLKLIGIPSPLTQCNSSKVIFTTRNEEVCGDMEATHKFPVEGLPWDKAWRLFQDKVGNETLYSHPGIPELAEIIAKECGGLPLTLITIGRAMSTKKSVEEWKDAITTLTKSASEFQGMSDEVLSRLKLSYDYLRNDTIKSCFLYCALYPKDHSIYIPRLIEYWTGEGFLSGFDNLDETRNHGHTVIETLKRACLLESSVLDEMVKMHDVIRDLALWIVNDKFLVASNVSERWKNVERIFWMTPAVRSNNEFENPPTSHNLVTLIVEECHEFESRNFCLPQSFFQFTPSLRVLVLSRIELNELPTSICELHQLQYLNLSYTGIKELPTSICELHELQYLNLSSTGIKELPIELRKLVKLKFLDLSHTTFLKKIPPGVIANLSELQCLDLFGSEFKNWELKEEGGGLSLRELKKLQEVGIAISSSLLLEKLLCNQNLRKICTSLSLKKCVNLKSISFPPSTIISEDFGNLTSLKLLSIFYCRELEELTLSINEDGETNRWWYNNKLKTLRLAFLPRLNNIVWGKTYHHYMAATQQQQPFQNLNDITIFGCDALKDLTWVVYLENLKELEVCSCEELETIIELGDDDGGLEGEGAGGGGGGDQMLNTGGRVFGRLKTLQISFLPKLKSIYRHALAFPSIDTIRISECPELKKLPLDSRSNVNNTLLFIKGSTEWWNELQWEDETTESKFLPYHYPKENEFEDDGYSDDFEEDLENSDFEDLIKKKNSDFEEDPENSGDFEEDTEKSGDFEDQTLLRGHDEPSFVIDVDLFPTEEVDVRLQSIDIIAAEMDKNLQKDDDQHEPRKHTEEFAISPQSINIIAANMDKNLQEITTRPQTVEIIAAEVDKNFQKDYQQVSRGREVLESLGMAGYMFEKAWSLLGEDDDDEIRIMGLYGQGGVGKTTLLKQINNEFIKSRYQRGLDIVILVLVSKPLKVEVIQNKIAKSLKLPLEGDESRRAEEIFKVLRNKNFVLLLDDIWEKIDLQRIGVPCPPQGKSKIIFTTRLKIVCRLMEADKTFKVECLPWNKAWSLFQENVGEEALNFDPRVPELAKIIARECAGLPLALITIGRAMSSKKSLQEWNDTITTLREFGSGCSGICDEGFSRLKLSYDNLHSETTKSCFLYCSLYPEHHSIPKSQLIDFWIGEGIFQWVDDIDEVRNRAYDIIENLKGAFLLESGEDEETIVKMHDVIRDLALWIVNGFGRRKDKSLVERATGTPNTSDKWESAERIYLSVDIDTNQEEEEEDEEEFQNDIQMETAPWSPNLLTLMVHGNSYYAELFLPQNFFQFMPLLRVLDFSELEMEEFPTSITELVELQYLGLAKTNIEALPDELRKLVKLKYLDLSHTYFLKKIPPGVIASLSELRVFNEYHSEFGDWEEDGPSLRELTSLRHLDDLGITIETVIALQRLLRNRKLRMCTRRLNINECINLKSLALLSSSTTTTLSLGNLKRLKELVCQNCSALAELTMNWAVVENGQKGLLSNLETLTLWNLPKLNVVWEKQYVCSSFQNLKEISIIGCNALKDLTWLVYVRNLETLYLRKCHQVEEILDVDGFGRGGDEMLTRDVVFKELKNIYMGNLVRLERICKHALAFPSLKSMVVEDCPHLNKLPLDCDSNVNNTLQRIEGGATWWNQLYWEDDQVKSKFLPYYEE